MLITTKKVLAAGLTALIAVSAVSAKPKKMTKEQKAQSKQLETQFKKAGYVVQKNSKGKVWDFDGMSVVVADWWSSANGLQNEASKSPVEEDGKKFRQFVMNTYNCEIDQVGIGGWGSHPQTVANFCTTGGDENYVFIIDGRSISAGLKANLFYDLSSIKSINWNNSKWVKSVQDKTAKGSSFYGCRPIRPEPRGGVFFNKRLLKEANIDPDSIYDMQAAGTWTWDAFEKMLKATTRDIDNDGVMDTYGMANLSTEFCHLAVMSNGTSWIGKDGAGKYYSMCGDEKTVEAMNWASRMCQNYEKPAPEGANWDWMYASFMNGEVAFQADQEYRVGNIEDMRDDWGFVCFPLGPKGDGKYKTLHDDNTYVIPGCYDKERAENIAKIFDLWSDPTPGYGDDSWREDYYARFRDERAVDETLQLMNDNGIVRYDTLISGLNLGNIIWNVYPGYKTMQEAVEETANSFQALIEEANR
ncbi:MAG: ABC transporter substrate-binding protein [Treponema sp.]|nr:ABC transporter substrate-binding protein [Treponema sp.]